MVRSNSASFHSFTKLDPFLTWIFSQLFPIKHKKKSPVLYHLNVISVLVFTARMTVNLLNKISKEKFYMPILFSLLAAFCFRYLPVGVLFLVTHQVLEVQDWGAIIKLGKLSGLVLLGYVHLLCLSFINKLKPLLLR